MKVDDNPMLRSRDSPKALDTITIPIRLIGFNTFQTRKKNGNLNKNHSILTEQKLHALKTWLKTEFFFYTLSNEKKSEISDLNKIYTKQRSFMAKPNQTKSNQVKSNQIILNQTKSNQVESYRIQLACLLA